MAPLKIQLMSDLHLESPKAYDIYEITPEANYLALLGDIGCTKDPGLLQFLELQLHRFRVVFFLYGNHEPYGSDWDHAKAILRGFSDEVAQRRTANLELGEFVILDQTRYDLSRNVTVLGCTLFSMIGPTRDAMDRVSFGLNDFYDIAGWTVEKHNEAHTADLEWLNAQVAHILREEPDRKVVIFSHHSPTQDPRASDPAHIGSPITSGFSTDLSEQPCWTCSNIVVWAFEHTHFNCDFQSCNSRVRAITNQRGYYFAQAQGFQGDKIIEI